MDVIDKIYYVLDYNADILGINSPWIKIGSIDEFSTPTTRAAVSNDASSVKINEDYLNYYSEKEHEIDIWLDFSHESRHIWQKKNGLFDLKTYKVSAEVGLKEYNVQNLEFDAWCWSTAMLMHKFNVVPRIEYLIGEENFEKMVERAKELLKEFPFDYM